MSEGRERKNHRMLESLKLVGDALGALDNVPGANDTDGDGRLINTLYFVKRNNDGSIDFSKTPTPGSVRLEVDPETNPYIICLP